MFQLSTFAAASQMRYVAQSVRDKFHANPIYFQNFYVNARIESAAANGSMYVEIENVVMNDCLRDLLTEGGFVFYMSDNTLLVAWN
jgi:hypothetical protein